MNISGFDFNLLRALHFLLEEVHVTRAAECMNITPAAASNVLKRLRVAFNDPLLLRKGRTLQRTPLGDSLLVPVREAMGGIQRVLSLGAPFSPMDFDGTFHVALRGEGSGGFLPSLDRILTARSPHATLRVSPERQDVGLYLRKSGGVALLMGAPADDDLEVEVLGRLEFSCVFRHGHPLAAEPWSLETFSRAEHIIVARPDAQAGASIEDFYARHGLPLRVARVVTSFESALRLALNSDRIALIPAAAADPATLAQPHVVRPLPANVPPQEFSMCWHKRYDADPRNRWLRSVLVELITSGVRAAASPTVSLE